MINPDAQPNEFQNAEIVAPAADSSVSHETVVFPAYDTNREVNNGAIEVGPEAPVDEELVLDFDQLRQLPPEERNAALFVLAGKMVKKVSQERSIKEEEKSKGEYVALLAENVAEAEQIQAEMDAEDAAIVEKYGSLEAAPLNVRQTTNSHKLGWGFVGVAAIGTLGALAPTQAEARDHGDIIGQFGKQAQRQIAGQAREAGADVGSTIGQTLRIIVNRKVNEAAVRVLEGADVPVERAPEEVVIVPRNIPGAVTPGVGGRIYQGAPVVGGGYEVRGARGIDQQAQSEQVQAQAQYAREYRALETKWTQAEADALYARQQLEVKRLNAQYAQRFNQAKTAEEQDLVQAECLVAKTEMKARHEREGPQADFARLERSYQDRGVNIQISAQERAAMKQISQHRY